MDRPQLEYAPNEPGAGRRRALRIALWVGVAIVAVLFFARALPDAWRTARVLEWQRRAMADLAPPDQTVAVYEPNSQADWLRRGLHRSTVPNLLFRPDPAWEGLTRTCGETLFRDWPILFLHERRNAHGSRLIVVSWGPSGDFNSDSTFSVWAAVYAPGTWRANPSLLSQMRLFDGFVSDRSRTVYHAGQPDPSDPSHFTITCESDGSPSTVDGWLEDDDTVKLELRKP